jgi:hypothetical protein
MAGLSDIERQKLRQVQQLEQKAREAEDRGEDGQPLRDQALAIRQQYKLFEEPGPREDYDDD